MYLILSIWPFYYWRLWLLLFYTKVFSRPLSLRTIYNVYNYLIDFRLCASWKWNVFTQLERILNWLKERILVWGWDIKYHTSDEFKIPLKVDMISFIFELHTRWWYWRKMELMEFPGKNKVDIATKYLVEACLCDSFHVRTCSWRKRVD